MQTLFQIKIFIKYRDKSLSSLNSHKSRIIRISTINSNRNSRISSNKNSSNRIFKEGTSNNFNKREVKITERIFSNKRGLRSLISLDSNKDFRSKGRIWWGSNSFNSRLISKCFCRILLSRIGIWLKRTTKIKCKKYNNSDIPLRALEPKSPLKAKNSTLLLNQVAKPLSKSWNFPRSPNSI